MVEREQVVAEAEARARDIIDQATDEANLMKRQTEEFCSERLEAIEAILEKTLGAMQRGREKLLAPEETGGPDNDGFDSGDNSELASVERIDLRTVQRRMFK
jgi:hypothetical protein